MHTNSRIYPLYSPNNHNLGSNVSEAVFQQIWLAIVDSELSPGSAVTEASLSTRFGVSRTPMREAIQRLVSIGLIQRSRGRSMRICKITVRSMENLTMTRERLEGLVAWQVWDRARRGEIELDRLKELQNRHETLAPTRDLELLLTMGLEFHHELRALCGNEVVVAMLEQILLALEPYRRLANTRVDRCNRVIDEHREVLSLLVADDGDAAEAAMRQHISHTRDFYRERLGELANSVA